MVYSDKPLDFNGLAGFESSQNKILFSRSQSRFTRVGRAEPVRAARGGLLSPLPGEVDPLGTRGVSGRSAACIIHGVHTAEIPIKMCLLTLNMSPKYTSSHSDD